MKRHLHHVGGVRANHDQLAMRHVDHTHQPVGDGQTQRRQQQHRSQADAAENLAQPLAPGQAVGDLGQGALQRLLHGRVLLVGQALVEQQLRVGRFLVRQRAHGMQTLLRVFAGQFAGRLGAFEQCLDFSVLLLG
ncbi:hypothetical protein SDC9_174202 [bioreactor metagenome]|uniref:Uncharacterized protein n=1 Tax=bioreactor metagenome TaxID=1076179 RepID=A0A645GIR5_9ZZZZ